MPANAPSSLVQQNVPIKRRHLIYGAMLKLTGRNVRFYIPDVDIIAPPMRTFCSPRGKHYYIPEAYILAPPRWTFWWGRGLHYPPPKLTLLLQGFGQWLLLAQGRTSRPKALEFGISFRKLATRIPRPQSTYVPVCMTDVVAKAGALMRRLP